MMETEKAMRELQLKYTENETEKKLFCCGKYLSVFYKTKKAAMCGHDCSW